MAQKAGKFFFALERQLAEVKLTEVKIMNFDRFDAEPCTMV